MKRILSSGVSFIASIACASAVQAATITVNAGGNLQSALDAARPGDTIVLQAGAVFTGDFTLPAKGGADYITIRSSAPDGSLPPAGSRITPSSAPLLAKIRSTSAGPAFRTAAGASYWRFLFLEIFPSSSTSSSNLVEFGSFSQTTLASVPHHLVMDRCYLHGDPGFGQRRGVALNSAHTEIANSYFSDFKGVNQDTQAVGGSNGPGPFVIDNNYIEAAGENIMFGGSDPKIPYLVPANIVIRRNLVTKPLAWRTQAWSVKNLIELKNAEAVLIEGNIIENNWAAGQSGYAFMFTPRNQEGTAPWSVVRNVTVQNNVIRHVAAVVNVLGTDNVRPSQQTTGIVIRNNLAYDVSTAYGSAGHPANGWFAVIGAAPRDITIDHNTVDNDGGAVIEFYGSGSNVNIYGFVLTNNLMRRNSYGLFGDNVGEGTRALSMYTPGAIVLRNTFADAAASLYPTGNDFPSLTQWLADFANLGSANYQLGWSSRSRNAATDGKNLGVDFAELNAAAAGSSTPIRFAPPADLVVYRPGDGTWYTLKSSANFAASTGTQFGLSTEVPVLGDYDGDGKADPAIFRPSTGTWVMRHSSTGGTSTVQWGNAADTLVPGDYDGDGKTDVAVFRPSNGTWYFQYSSTGIAGGVQWGNGLDVPVPADYDGDGKTDMAVFRPANGTWYILNSATGTTTGFQWGNGLDVPVPGDYDGDGKADMAVFRPSNGTWLLTLSKTRNTTGAQWGNGADVPMPADYDGDGKTDIAVFRPSNGTWYLLYSSGRPAAGIESGNGADIPMRQR